MTTPLMESTSTVPEEAIPTTADRRTIAEITELAGGLAHELRNPLSTMMINLKLLTEYLEDTTASPEDIRRRALVKLDVLRHEAERLQTLFDDFLHLTGPYRLSRTPTDLMVVVDRLVAFLEPVFRSGKVEVTIIRPDQPLRCPVDEKLISQSLLNILLNAQQSMPDGGILTISVEALEDWGVVSVTDTGVGIAPQQRESVFRPFFSTKEGGSGLGLSITRRIIQEHGGTLTLQSQPGEGTTFVVRLPMRVAGDDCSGSC